MPERPHRAIAALLSRVVSPNDIEVVLHVRKVIGYGRRVRDDVGNLRPRPRPGPVDGMEDLVVRGLGADLPF